MAKRPLRLFTFLFSHPMTDQNKTSMAVKHMEKGMYLKNFANEALAICAKYEKMEAALQLAKNVFEADSIGKCPEAIKDALSFDPLP